MNREFCIGKKASTNMGRGPLSYRSKKETKTINFVNL